MLPITKLLAVAGFTLATLTPLGAQESSSKAERTFSRITTQLKSGEGEAALKSMTDATAEEFLRTAMLSVADAVAFGEEVPKAWPDGTAVKATPASLGFDKFEFPKWYLDEDGVGGSRAQNEKFEKSLTALLDQVPDRAAALHALYLMSEALFPSELSAKIVPPKDGIKPAPNRVWVEIDYGNGEIETTPLLFKPEGEELKYAGTDWDFVQQQRKQWRFVEKKDLPLAGMADNDKVVKLADYKDKVILLDFWGTT